ncbi:multidrug resistance-associated protein 1-like [Tropilaelaps mercedesae]|uniref:Multidrug resistance-associated protein 1-like n=1 Tax=Tropilaelaps mercedesae TaxID=418985 RepID=A0A1V9XUC8_9ACAR|nr:multidrug resistance-associated protein 1-like [Tropilaelaps mercedesae]
MLVLTMSGNSSMPGRPTISDESEEGDPKNCRYTDRKPNLWNRLTFGHLTRVILKGSWETIEAKDLNPLHTLFTAKDTSERLLRLWKAKYSRMRHDGDGDTLENGLVGDLDTDVFILPDSKSTKINMVWLVINAFWPHFLLAFICKLFQLSAGLLPPFLVGYLLDVLKNKEMPDRYGYYVAGVLFLSQQMSSLMTAHIYGTLLNIGIKCRSGFSSVIYQKALRLSSKSTKEFSTGDVINLVSVDLQNVMRCVMLSVSLWGSPINVRCLNSSHREFECTNIFYTRLC